MDNLSTRHPRSPTRTPGITRNASPNNVVINGQIVDKKSSGDVILFKKPYLEEIIEECETSLESPSYFDPLDPLDDVVKQADENVQKFIEEISFHSSLREDTKEFQDVCKKSQEELRGLTNFLCTIDESSKGKIVNTLIDVFKTEILTGIKEIVPNISNESENEDKIGKFKNVCKSLIHTYQKNELIEDIDMKLKSGPEHARICQINDYLENITKPHHISVSQSEVENEFGLEGAETNQCNKDRDEQFQSSSQIEEDSQIDQEKTRRKPLNLKANYVLNYHTDFANDPQLQNSKKPFEDLWPDFATWQKRFDKGKHHGVIHFPKVNAQKKVSAHLPLEIRHSKEQEIRKILGKKAKKPIAQTQYVKKLYSKIRDENVPLEPEKKKKFVVNSKSSLIKVLVSEGIQASKSLIKKPIQHENNSVNFVKPYKYRYDFSLFDSQSDYAIDCPFGCQLNLKKSKCYSNLHKHSSTDFKAASRSSIIIGKKSSQQLLKAKDLRRQKPLIHYLDRNLKRGDSEFQFSQILFEKESKNFTKDISSFEIPVVEVNQVDDFNPNYLLHSLKLQDQTKSAILSKTPKLFESTLSDLSVTEDEYRAWLSQQNWSKYSKASQNLPVNFDDLRSVSEETTKKADNDIIFKSFLDRGDYSTNSSYTDYISLISKASEILLYEHVVISNALNFISTYNAQRTRILSIWDRCVQVMFFVAFYGLWLFFSGYVLAEPSKKNTILWQ